MKISAPARKAILLGSICSVSYLAVYFARNLLGSASPQMIEAGNVTTEEVGVLSSVYFISYAVGQLINGWIGDRIKAKYMISAGLCCAGLCNFAFLTLLPKGWPGIAVYGLMGYFLSMVYAPMVKTVAENTEPIYATRCNIGYMFAAFFGSPLAGVAAALLHWRAAFILSGIILLAMAASIFALFTIFEKKTIICYGKYKAPQNEKKRGGVSLLISRRIIPFSVVSVMTGIVRTSVVFWLPTYLSQHLGFSADTSAFIFAAATFVISCSPFFAVLLYENVHWKLSGIMSMAFSSASVGFLMVFLIRQPSVNIAFLVIAILSSNICASLLYSCYCPSLRDTGMVSTAIGFLDCIGYLAASGSSVFMSYIAERMGWSPLILAWLALMLTGLAVMTWETLRKKGRGNGSGEAARTPSEDA